MPYLDIKYGEAITLTILNSESRLMVIDEGRQMENILVGKRLHRLGENTRQQILILFYNSDSGAKWRNMRLSRYTLKYITPEKVILPKEGLFDLPEKVLQFGTGGLLRGLPDYFIDKANNRGIFNGRIVAVKMTSGSGATAFHRQDNLYTSCVRDTCNGETVQENIVNSSVSRVLVAQNEWSEILEIAHNENFKIIISNTSEAAIRFVNDDVRRYPPISFPGKLLAFLYERFIAFDGSEQSGFVIIPTDLIFDNGTKLESIVLELAYLNSLEDEFIEWLEKCNYFCNSLADRIITGIPDEKRKNEIENKLGYKDDLMIELEKYGLWVIEGDEKIRNILSFAEVDERVIVTSDIELYCQLKLHLLDCTYTLSCGAAFLAGFDTVQNAMENHTFLTFVTRLMRDEISPSINYKIRDQLKKTFISKVISRFCNCHIHDYWSNITRNYSYKMIACFPLFHNYYKKNKAVPQLFAFSFACYLYFMKAVKQKGKEFLGEFNGDFYLINDPLAERFYYLWSNKSESIDRLVQEVLKDISFWKYDLSSLPGFQDAVINNLNSILNGGMKSALEKVT